MDAPRGRISTRGGKPRRIARSARVGRTEVRGALDCAYAPPVVANASGALCERCGAPLSLARGDRARCLFCLHEQRLPAAVAAPLSHDAALALRLDAHEAKLRTYRRSRWGVLAVLAVALPGVACSAVAIFGSAWAQRGDPLAFAMYAFIGVGGLGIPLAVPLLWMRVRDANRARVLAALPAAVPRVADAQLTSTCPRCGAPHGATAQLTATCGHCGTEALLPLPLVDVRLARRHAQVLDARRRGDAEVDAAKAAVDAWQRVAVPMILGLCVLFGAGVVVFVVLAELRGP